MLKFSERQREYSRGFVPLQFPLLFVHCSGPKVKRKTSLKSLPKMLPLLFGANEKKYGAKRH
jgi:hypothetical protein